MEKYIKYAINSDYHDDTISDIVRLFNEYDEDGEYCMETTLNESGEIIKYNGT